MSPSGLGHVPTKKLGLAAALAEGNTVAVVVGVAGEFDPPVVADGPVDADAPTEHAPVATRQADRRTRKRTRSTPAPHRLIAGFDWLPIPEVSPGDASQATGGDRPRPIWGLIG